MDFSPILVILITAALAAIACRDLDGRERRLAMTSFGAHVVGSVMQWAIMLFYYGDGGDLTGYRGWGEMLAKLINFDPLRNIPEVWKLVMHVECRIPFQVTGEGTSTGTMSGVAGLIMAVTGPSLLTLCLVASGFSWFGQLCMYRVARAELLARDRSAAMIGFLLVPSVIYWGAGYTKESLVIGCFGILIRSTWTLARNRRPLAMVGLVFGGVGVALIKPYTLFAYVFALAAFVYADRAWRKSGKIRIRFAYLLLAAGIAIGGLVVMGRVFPQFGVEKMADTVALNQETWREGRDNGTSGGSSIELGSGEARSVSQQIVFVPIAFVNSFFRPVLFEARGAPMLGAAVESTLLTIAALSLLGGAARRVAIETLARTPLLVFSITFAVLFGIGVGLATGNLGTLSRYRMPMMPFYVTTVLLLRQRGRDAARSAVAAATRARPLGRAGRSRAA